MLVRYRSSKIALTSIFLVLAGCRPAIEPVARESKQVKAERPTVASSEPLPPPPPPALHEYDAVMAKRARADAAVGGAVGVYPSAPMSTAQMHDAAFNTEEYGRFEENTFVLARETARSTFSIDVDRASYSNVRRFIKSGQLPPRDAVRIEEMINYFTYSYPEPSGANPFAVVTDVAACPWNSAHKLLRVGLQARRVDVQKLPPSNLTFLLDVSGSMSSPDKLPLVKQSLNKLIDQLRPQDRVAIVVYAGSAGLVLDSTPGSSKNAIAQALEQLEAGGSTAGGEGIVLAYRVAKENFIRGGNNRVILATDGDFNVGVSSDGELERLIEEKRREGIALTVLGFGTGNIKDSKMELLADKGNGNYAYIDSEIEAQKVLVEEMGGTLFTVAKDVKIQIEFNPARVAAYRLIGYENRALRDHEFRDDTKDAGEIGAGHSVTALYELVPAGTPVPGIDIEPLKYQKTTLSEAAASSELATLRIRHKKPDADTSSEVTYEIGDGGGSAPADLRFAAAVAEFGMLLRDSRHKGDASFDEVLLLARSAQGMDREGYRRDFIAMVEAARDLAPRKIASEPMTGW